MSESKLITQNQATTIGDTDLVMVSGASGGLKPISASNFQSSMQNIGNQYKKTVINYANGDWIRIARCKGEYTGIVCITHGWNEVPPSPILFYIGGQGSISSARCFTENCAFSALRIVSGGSEGNYMEVKFANIGAQNIIVTVSNNCNITLLDATISNASASNVLKTIDFSADWGGINQRFTTTCESENLTEMLVGDCLLTVRQKGGAHERIEEREQSSDSHNSLRCFDDMRGCPRESKDKSIKSPDHQGRQPGRNERWRGVYYRQPSGNKTVVFGRMELWYIGSIQPIGECIPKIYLTGLRYGTQGLPKRRSLVELENIPISDITPRKEVVAA